MLLATVIVALNLPTSFLFADVLHRGDIVIPEFYAQGLLKVNPVTGATTPLASVHVDSKALLTIDQQNQIVYLDNNEHLMRLDPATSVATTLSLDTFTFANGLAIEPNGNLLISSNKGVYRVDAQTGISTLFSHGNSFSPSSLAVTPVGDIYVNEFFNGLQKIDPVTGAATHVPGTNVTIFDNGMISDAAGNLILANGSNLLRIDPILGVQTTIASNTATFPHGVAVEPDGHILVATHNSVLLRFDPVTGAPSTLSGGTFFYPLSVAVAVPEPTSLALFGLAIVGIVVARCATRRGSNAGC